MARPARRLQALSVAFSIAAHAVVIVALWLHGPRLMRPHEPSGPPEPIIPVLIMPRAPPVAGSGQRPPPIRLHRRRLRPELGPSPVEPLIAEKAPEPPPPAAPKPALSARITVQPSPGRQVVQTLRASPIGCANPTLLSRDEREACEARLARGLAQAPYLGPALGAKQAGFDTAAAGRRTIQLPPAPGATAQPSSGPSNRNRPLETPQLTPLRP